MAICKGCLEITKLNIQTDSMDVEMTRLRYKSETTDKEKILGLTLSKITWTAVRFFVSFLICW